MAGEGELSGPLLCLRLWPCCWGDRRAPYATDVCRVQTFRARHERQPDFMELLEAYSGAEGSSVVSRDSSNSPVSDTKIPHPR